MKADLAGAPEVQAPAHPPCRLCGGASSFEFVIGDRNRGLGDSRFEYRRCSVCESVFLPTVPEDLARYYAEDGYGSVTDEELPQFVPGEEVKLELVGRLAPGRTIVEIGPGPGKFTRVAQRAGYDVTAIEMDPEYCRQLHAVLGVRAIESGNPAEVLPTLEPSAAIVMWHVIEHLPDPWEVLARCVENLQPGGVLALSTPNPGSLQFRLLGRYWAHLDAPRHLQLIPLGTLQSRLASLGMRHELTTSSDPVGLNCNHLGWEFAVRLRPALLPSTRVTMALSGSITRALAGVERRPLVGSTYTAVFRRPIAEA